jgi:hypothetical protein
MLQHLAGGRVDLMLGRGNTGPVYPWFGQDIRNGIPLAIENHAMREVRVALVSTFPCYRTRKCSRARSAPSTDVGCRRRRSGSTGSARTPR